MKNETLDTILKITFIVAVLVVALSIAYYLVFFLPKQEATRLEAQRQEQQAVEARRADSDLRARVDKCFIDAKKFHEAYIASMHGFYEEPKYSYNQKLGKCLYSGGYSKAKYPAPPDLASSPDYYWERWVKDVYANETILSVYNFQSVEVINNYWGKHDELMSN